MGCCGLLERFIGMKIIASPWSSGAGELRSLFQKTRKSKDNLFSSKQCLLPLPAARSQQEGGSSQLRQGSLKEPT